MADQLGLDDAARLLDETLQGREADWKLTRYTQKRPPELGRLRRGTGAAALLGSRADAELDLNITPRVPKHLGQAKRDSHRHDWTVAQDADCC